MSIRVRQPDVFIEITAPFESLTASGARKWPLVSMTNQMRLQCLPGHELSVAGLTGKWTFMALLVVLHVVSLLECLATNFAFKWPLIRVSALVPF